MTRVLATLIGVTTLIGSIAVASPGSAAAGAASATNLPVLAGTVVLEGRVSGMMEVRLPRPATFDAFRPGPGRWLQYNMTVHGDGRFVGMFLHKEVRYTANWANYWPSAWGVEPGICTTAGCRRPVTFGALSQVYVDPAQNRAYGHEHGTLPAGVYELALIADDAPVVVTFHLGGLPGRVVLHPPPTRYVQIEPGRVTQDLPGGAAGHSVWAAGVTHKVIGEGFLTDDVWSDEPLPDELTGRGYCGYNNHTPTSYTYPCQNADFSTGLQIQGNGPADGAYLDEEQFQLFEPPGVDSDGFYSDTAGPVTSAHLNELAVNFPK